MKIKRVRRDPRGKLYQCRDCGQGFSFKDDIDEHQQQTGHTGISRPKGFQENFGVARRHGE